MDNFWANFAMEIALFVFLGVLYYFYQKRKLLNYEENKTPMVMGYILQSCLMSKEDKAQPELDSLIEALDDFLQNKTTTPPYILLNKYAASTNCPEELRHIILEGIKEISDG
jgi:hypothetical protein